MMDPKNQTISKRKPTAREIMEQIMEEAEKEKQQSITETKKQDQRKLNNLDDLKVRLQHNKLLNEDLEQEFEEIPSEILKNSKKLEEKKINADEIIEKPKIINGHSREKMEKGMDAHKEASEYLRNYKKSLENIKDEDMSFSLKNSKNPSICGEKIPVNSTHLVQKQDESQSQKAIEFQHEGNGNLNVLKNELNSPRFQNGGRSESERHNNISEKNAQKTRSTNLGETFPSDESKSVPNFSKKQDFQVGSPSSVKIKAEDTPLFKELKAAKTLPQEPLNEGNSIYTSSKNKSSREDPFPETLKQKEIDLSLEKRQSKPNKPIQSLESEIQPKIQIYSQHGKFVEPLESYELLRQRVENYQRELAEKEKLICLLERRFQESDIYCQGLHRKIEELQEENDSLLKMNFELTKEKTSLKIQVEGFKKEGSPLATLSSTQSSHFYKDKQSAETKPTESLTSSFKLPPKRENDEYLTKLSEILRIPNATREEIITEIENLGKLKKFGRDLEESAIFYGMDCRRKLEKVEAFFGLFDIRPNEDFINRINQLYNEVFNLRTFCRELREALELEHLTDNTLVFRKAVSILRQISRNS